MSAQVGNPIHAYNLIRRFSIDIGNIERDIQEDDWAGDKNKIQNENAKSKKINIGNIERDIQEDDWAGDEKE